MKTDMAVKAEFFFLSCCSGSLVLDDVETRSRRCNDVAVRLLLDQLHRLLLLQN